MVLDRVEARPGSTVTLSYIFKDDLGQPVSPDSPVSVSMYADTGSIIEAELTAELEGSYKCVLSYTVPVERQIGAYLVNFTATKSGYPLSGYLQLDVVLVTDADFVKAADSSVSSIAYDGASIAYDSPAQRIEALRSMKPPAVGRMTKNRSLTTDLDYRDYVRF